MIEAKKAYLEVVHVRTLSRVEQMVRSGTVTTAALLIVHRDVSHIYQLMQWAALDVAANSKRIYQDIVWNVIPFITARLDAASLESYSSRLCHTAWWCRILWCLLGVG